MTIRQEHSVKRFIGQSADVKPVVGTLYDGTVTTATDLPAGSTFLEEDIFLADGTQRIARWNGSAWTYPLIVDGDTVSLTAAVDALRLEIAALRLGMIEAGTCKFVNPNDAADLAAA